MASQGDGIPAPRPVRRRQGEFAVGGVDPQGLPREHDSGLEFPRHARQVREDGAEHSQKHHRPRRRRRRCGEEEGEDDGGGGFQRGGDEGGGAAGEGFGGEGGGEVEERCEEAEEGFEGEDARGFQGGG